MITIRLMGGLGNQLFQYAFGRNLALKNNCDLKFDLSYFENNEIRNYELKHFFIDTECTRLSAYHRRFFNTSLHFIQENGPEFNSGYLVSKKNIYLDGYWQSEKYFIDSAPQIRKDLHIKTPPTSKNQQMLSSIASTNAISIHIRRGDYVTDTNIRIHGLCSVNYYKDAIALIAKQTPEPVFYLFSDDMEWVKNNWKFDYKTVFVDINDAAAAYEDLRLMSACKHHIIANSSFSWWGAWLNLQPDKMVIAPKNWFSDTAMNIKADSIVPDNWLSI